jgi:hypothetical protein
MTDTRATQVPTEHWLRTDPSIQVTSVVVEHWCSMVTVQVQAIVTQVLIEHWGRFVTTPTASGGPMVTMIG